MADVTAPELLLGNSMLSQLALLKEGGESTAKHADPMETQNTNACRNKYFHNFRILILHPNLFDALLWFYAHDNKITYTSKLDSITHAVR